MLLTEEESSVFATTSGQQFVVGDLVQEMKNQNIFVLLFEYKCLSEKESWSNCIGIKIDLPQITRLLDVLFIYLKISYIFL